MLTRGARWKRLATAARFLLRSLSMRGSSYLLALLAITVGATVTATMLNIRADLGAKMSRELRRFGPNLLVTPAPAPGSSAGGTIDQARALGLPALLEARERNERGSRAPAAERAVVSPLLIAAGTIDSPPRRGGGRGA